MSHKIISFVLVVILLAVFITVIPTDTSAETYGDLTYDILGDDTVEITGYSGPGGALVIPDSIDGRAVSSIGAYAFDLVYSITSVSIGDNVTTIGSYAFWYCENINDIVFGVNVTTIGDYAFYHTAITSLTISEHVTTIGSCAFSYSMSLLSLTMSDNVTSIGSYAFLQCSSLREVTLSDNLTSIGDYAFRLTGLVSLTIPNNVTSIGANAFSACCDLMSMTFDGDAPTVGDNWASGSSMVVYFYQGANGFTTPIWNGVPSAELSVPSEPTNFVAIAGDGQVDLSWDPPILDGNLTIDHYTIYQNGTEVGTTAETDFTVQGLTNGLEYSFFISAHNALGDGANTSSVTTTPLCVTITSPVNNSYIYELFVEWTFVGNLTNINACIMVDGGVPTQIAMPATNYTTDIADGEHMITLVIIDADGNTASDTVTVIVDTTGPYIEITSPSGGANLDDGAVNITWAAVDTLSAIDHFDVCLFNGTAWDNTTSIGPSTTHLLLDLIDGTYTVYVTAFDDLGNHNGTSATFTIDTTPPTVDIITPSNGSHNTTGFISLTWMANDGPSGIDHYAICILDDDGWDNTTVTSSTNAIVLDLEDGAYTVHVIAVDRAGNHDQATVSFIVDTIGPSISITSPSASSYIDTGDVTIEWSAMDVVSGIDHFAVNADGTSWTNVTGTIYTFSLVDGEHTLYVRAFDESGNINEANVTICVDTVDPELEIVTPIEGGQINSSSVTVEWTADDDRAGIAHFLLKVDNGTWLYVGLGNLSAVIEELLDGEHIVQVEVIDQAGNTYCDAVTFVVDTVAPSLLVTSPSEGSYVIDNRTIITWAASDATSGIASVMLRVDDGSWMNMSGVTTYLADLVDGPHTVAINATDVAGNSVLVSVTFTVDDTEPTAEYGPVGNGVALNATLVIEFSEIMNTSATTVTITDIIGEASWDGNVLTFTPASLVHNGHYQVTVTGKDLAGNEIFLSWAFNTTEAGTIIGMLVDDDGNVMTNATVSMSSGTTATTDEYGRFTFANVTVGSHSLTVSLDGYENITMTVNVTADSTNDLGSLTVTSTAEGEDDDSNSMLIVFAAVVLIVAVLGAVTVFLRLRRK